MTITALDLSNWQTMITKLKGSGRFIFEQLIFIKAKGVCHAKEAKKLYPGNSGSHRSSR